MKLFIVRHAIAEDRVEFARTGEEDSQRPLTELGSKKMMKVAKGFKRIEDHLDALITSPYRRARQTADIMSAQFPKAPLIETPLLVPDAHPAALMTWVRGYIEEDPDRQHLALFGHEPHLGNMVTWLLAGESVRGFSPLKKASITCLEFPGPIKPAQAILKWSLPSKILCMI